MQQTEVKLDGITRRAKKGRNFMNLQGPRSGFPRQALHGVIAIVCVASLPWSSPLVLAQETPQAQSQEMTTTEEAPKISNDQLDSLVAPIALYADATARPDIGCFYLSAGESCSSDQWMEKNKNLKDKALADAVAKEPWDASVQSMAAFPDVVQRMAENVQWTTDVGNAFLAQQADVMDAVPAHARKGAGHRESQDRRGTESGDPDNRRAVKQVIVVEQANPETAYVPVIRSGGGLWGCTCRISLPIRTPIPDYQPGMALSLGNRPSPWVAHGAAAAGAITVADDGDDEHQQQQQFQ